MSQNFSYKNFETAIQQARLKTAMFYRVDLHVHTTNSHDFPSTHSKAGFVKKIPNEETSLRSDPNKFRKLFVERAKEQKLCLVAITDHNEADMAEHLSKLSDDELKILPGIEISVQTNRFPDSEVHIIAIFPEGTLSKQIDKVFPPNCGMPPSGSRGKGVATKQPVKEILENIRQLNGISIAAHVSGSNGIREMVQSQNTEWLEKNYLSRYLKSKKEKEGLTEKEIDLLNKLSAELKPLADKVQNEYLLFLAEHEFNAIQVQAGNHDQYYAGSHVQELNLSPFSCILSSDTHTLADLGCHGHGTHVKMTKPSLEGLKKAFLDPGTRIRYDATVPTARPKRILGMSFEGGSLDGQVIGFSDNLTTLIGGRGTGKSTVIEAIRFVLGQQIVNLPDKLKKDIQERLEFTLRNSEVKLLFSNEGQDELVVVKRRLGEGRPSCFALDGTAIPEIELPNSERIRAEIYGWNEIEALSDSPRKQLALLDRTITGINDLKLDLGKKQDELQYNTNKIVGLSREIQSLLPHVQGANELRQELEKLETPELNQAFASFDENDKALRIVRDLNKEVEANKDSLLYNGEKRDLKSNLINSLGTIDATLQNYSWQADLSELIRTGAANLQVIYDQLIDEFSLIQNKLKSYTSALDSEHDLIETQLNAIAEKSGQANFKSALSRRKELTEKLSTISGHEKEIQEKQSEIEKLLSVRRDQIIPGLMVTRENIYKARLEKAKSIAQKLSDLKAAKGVSIEIEYLGDKTSFSRALGYKEGQKYQGLFQKIDRFYISKNYPEFYATKYSPQEFVKRILDSIDNCDSLAISYIKESNSNDSEIVYIPNGNITEENDELVERDATGNLISNWAKNLFELVTMDDPEKVWKHLSPRFYDNEINKYYDPEKLENLLYLESTDVEDHPKILLDSRPIEGLSPGQRCSALIPIILVEGDTPLIIDQPEDNLDNKMVFDLVVDILRGLKEQRQIIVATHNPNIPVSGDAEQVIAFESPSKNICQVVAQGSIDEDASIEQIKAVMEGGEKAFEVRIKKYGALHK
ncbi:MAG: AAA family ATPase [Chloroflexi bacterium]|nr:AAA family ATPase [Chloroflexota bacterium]